MEYGYTPDVIQTQALVVTCCRLNRVMGCPDRDCCTGTGDTGLMNTMPLCCRARGLAMLLTPSGVWGAAKGLDPEIRPRFCRVKLRMAGLGLWRRCACWVVRGEAAAGL